MNYILVGTLAGILRGAPETTEQVEICPAPKEENLARLQGALKLLNVDTEADGRAGEDLRPHDPVCRLDTAFGELVIDLRPQGTDGFHDLRRQARRELLDDPGLRVSVASLADLLRSVRARGVADEAPRLQMYRRLNELEHQLERSRGRAL